MARSRDVKQAYTALMRVGTLAWRVIVIAGVVASVWLVVGAAGAAEPPKVQAKRHYDAGMTAFQAEQYGMAAQEFAAAYVAAPDPAYRAPKRSSVSGCASENDTASSGNEITAIQTALFQ